MRHEQGRWIVAVAVLACLSPLEPTADAQSGSPALGAAQPRPLEAYVAKPDPTYEWHVRGRYRYGDTELVELVLVSQKWKDVVWKHRLVLIKPPHVADPSRGV